MDPIKIAAVVGLIAAVALAFCIGYIVTQNLSSRNLALAVGAMAGSVLLLVVQLAFELRPDRLRPRLISAEYTIDRSKPQIRQADYTATSGWRLSLDIGASDGLAGSHPDYFQGDRSKLTLDMVMFSLIAYLGTEQFDWQMVRRQWTGSSVGSVIRWQPSSRPGQCTTITHDEIRSLLKNSGNAFADARISVGPQQICLPPGSKMEITPTTLKLTSPFCRMLFVLLPADTTVFYRPGSGGRDQPLLKNGESVYETRVTGIEVEVRFSAWRAQHPEMPRYKDWAEEVGERAQEWFQGAPNQQK